MIILDTSAIIELFSCRGKYKEIQQQIQLHSAAISALTINELLVDAHPNKKEILMQFIRSVHILSIDDKVAYKGVEIEEYLINHGIMTGRVDILIAATCLVHDVELLTLDKDFERINGLQIIKL